MAVSEDEIAMARDRFESLLQGEPEPWIALLAEDVRWDISAHPLPDVPDFGQGREESITVWATYVSGWNDYSAEITDVAAVGDDVVMEVHEKVRMGETDVPLERDIAYVSTFSEGRIVLLRVFKTAEEAKRAAGR